ncbi:VOC family protein [Halegenticoccus tardaugens]|uniref:VOC family protein n=1 Tax=Halegenticoccus tardaugens TaxID=2071624 RepID=UPI00100B7299|nr:VOC family protein [Halegenticoccus tardaugens]
MDLIHVNLNVADVDRALEFYTEELGFEETWGFDAPDGETVHRYVAADNGIEIQLSETEGETSFEEGTAWDHVALLVDDVDAAFKAIENHGVVKEPGDQPEAGVRTAFIRDPDGHKVELVGPLE